MSDTRRGLIGFTGQVIKSPARAIRAKCLDCCCGSSQEVRLCPATDCPLFPFRFGRNPFYGENASICVVSENESSRGEIISPDSQASETLGLTAQNQANF